MNLYHYTTEAHLPMILEDGSLKLTPSKEKLFPGERQLVWFSTMEDMPPSALKPIRKGGEVVYPTVEELDALIPLWRFKVVNRKAMKFYDWRTMSRKNWAMPFLEQDNLESPSTWRATTKRVKLEYLQLERRVGPQRYEPAEAPTGAHNVKIEAY